jgi:hypothetical protein
MTSVISVSSALGTASLVAAIFVFVVVFSFAFILLFSFKPSIVCKHVDNVPVSPSEPDTGKCVIGAAVVALVVLLIMWGVGAAAAGHVKRAVSPMWENVKVLAKPGSLSSPTLSPPTLSAY